MKQGRRAVSERPRAYIRIINEHHERQEYAEYAHVFGYGVFPYRVEYAGGRAVPTRSAVASEPPLYPHEGDAEEYQGYEIRYHEGAAAVIRGLHREPQKITEPYGVPSHGEYEPDPASPLLAFRHY